MMRVLAVVDTQKMLMMVAACRTVEVGVDAAPVPARLACCEFGGTPAKVCASPPARPDW